VKSAEAMRLLLEAGQRGETVVEVLVTESEDPTVITGGRMLVLDGRTEGGLGDDAVDGRARELAAELVRGEGTRSETLVRPGGPVTLYLSVHRPADDLVILGAGHIARPLCAIGAMLGYRVVVLDDRPDFATRERFPEASRVLPVGSDAPFTETPLSERSCLVLATRGHRFDFEALRTVLAADPLPAYIGMVGSRRRVRATLDQLAREGVPAERLKRIHAPVGLDVGAETPEEIAVAIAAELVLLRRGGSGSPLREKERVVDRWIRPPE
jgi:xanthine dehydrogenase accessory factor